jgi:hypothetical protein
MSSQNQEFIENKEKRDSGITTMRSKLSNCANHPEVGADEYCEECKQALCFSKLLHSKPSHRVLKYKLNIWSIPYKPPPSFHEQSSKEIQRK